MPTDVASSPRFMESTPSGAGEPLALPAHKRLDNDGRPPTLQGTVLSTLNSDGSRRWIKPRPSTGCFLTARRIVAYILIAIFALMPLARLNGRPLILLDIAAREFHILGATFYPTDTLLLALFAVGTFLTIFWMTAFLGRVWCGWACPQTVYMEFVFRPIERLFEGAPRANSASPVGPIARTAKLIVYAALALLMAHMFLAYFVSWDLLKSWIFGSPIKHPIGFAVVVITTIAILFDFGYFREQLCLVACPYGRMQSVMLDKHSLTIWYDHRRGEPRGKKRASTVSLPVLAPTNVPPGDCIDCTMCVTTCPTGIDIRNGLQMECIGCAQCIDACDRVMEKIGRPKGLIRYSSQAGMQGEKFRIMRPRVVLYPAVILTLALIFTLTLLNRGFADVTLLRGLGQPFTVMPDGQIRNNIRVKLTNRRDTAAIFRLHADGVEHATLTTENRAIEVPAGETIIANAEVHAPAAAFHHGQARISIVVSGPEDLVLRRPFVLVGPQTNQAQESGR
ncbi:MAG: cytochrome c oxidase accessory protein CcoG [Phycisphaerales bacterium]|nr:cytochrome c oxidase accessory protein CcoG [Phycisphaerales bacterium]